MNVHSRRAAGALAFCAAFELLARANPGILPPTTEILRQAVALAADAGFRAHAATSALAWASGLGLAVLVAVPLGVLLGTVPALGAATRAILEFLRPIPSVALIPLVALLIGTGLQLRVALVVYASVWPLLYNTMYGLREVDPLAKESLRAFGFGRAATLVRVSLPSAAPFIGTGLRLAAGVALILTISVEVVGGRGQGVGIFIALAGTVDGRLAGILAAVAWVGLFGLGVNAALVAAERRLFPWHWRRT
ncbi:ABC transporter permease [Nonomuraea sp. NPDC050394]|uniref:ABC transporter permease n=1 Tax=Nonomuraea sp. NPDC050394 TaxID=3364363 RepID=UPI0037A5FCAD